MGAHRINPLQIGRERSGGSRISCDKKARKCSTFTYCVFCCAAPERISQRHTDILTILTVTAAYFVKHA